MTTSSTSLATRGVSPVIGVGLMVVVTVAIATVILVFVMGIHTPTTHTGDVQITENAELGEVTVTFDESGTTDRFRVVTASGEWYLETVGDAVTVNATSDIYVISIVNGNEQLIQMYTPTDVTIDNVGSPPQTGECHDVIDNTSGAGDPGDPHHISTIQEFQCINVYPDDHYIQTNDIDAGGTITWYGGYGFVPLGGDDTTNDDYVDGDNTPFTGSYDGDGHRITGLYLDYPGEEHIGPFGYVEGGDILNVTFSAVSVTGEQSVGGVVGHIASGDISDVNVGGDVTGDRRTGGLVGAGATASDDTPGHVRIEESVADVTVDVTTRHAGGLVGKLGYYTDDTDYHDNVELVDSTARGDVTADQLVGGLVGETYGTIDGSSATGTVTGADMHIGGLVGWGMGNITDSTASGDVIGTNTANAAHIGGLAGTMGADTKSIFVETGQGSIIDSSTSGNILLSTDDGDAIGGLVGRTYTSGVHNSYATGGAIDAGKYSNHVGGLVGKHGVTHGTPVAGDINDSHSEVDLIYAGRYVGGLVGSTSSDWGGTFDNTYATSDVTASFRLVGGLIGSHASWEPLTISNSYSTGAVDIDEAHSSIGQAGGLGGYLTAVTLTDSYATGDVTVEQGSEVGGLVGSLRTSTVTESYATGDVTVDSGDEVGGLAGFLGETDISEVYATGDVTAPTSADVGGFAGSADWGADISDAYALGHIDGDDNVAGFIGFISDDSYGEVTVDTSYSAGTVTADDPDGGGFVATNIDGVITDSYYNENAHPASDGGAPLAPDDMQGDSAETHLTGFDFTAIWETITNPDEYPAFPWDTRG